MMFRYRKKVGPDFKAWHFAERCGGWPRAAYIEREDRPSVDELCDECISLFGDQLSEDYRKHAAIEPGPSPLVDRKVLIKTF